MTGKIILALLAWMLKRALNTCKAAFPGHFWMGIALSLIGRGTSECCRSSVTQRFPRQLSYRDVFTLSDGWENNFFFRRFPRPLMTQDVWAAEVSRRVRGKDRTALASSWFVADCSPLWSATIRLNRRVQRPPAATDLADYWWHVRSCTGWKVTVRRWAEDSWWCGKILESSESSFKLIQDPVLIFARFNPA